MMNSAVVTQWTLDRIGDEEFRNVKICDRRFNLPGVIDIPVRRVGVSVPHEGLQSFAGHVFRISAFNVANALRSSWKP